MIVAAKKRITEGKWKSPMIVATWQSKFGEDHVVAISRNKRNIKALVFLKEHEDSPSFSTLLWSRYGPGFRDVSDEKAIKFENEEIDGSDTFDINFLTTGIEDRIIRDMQKWPHGSAEYCGKSVCKTVNFCIERAFADDWFEGSYEELCTTENSKLEKTIREADLIKKMNNKDLSTLIFQFTKLDPKEKLKWGFKYPTFHKGGFETVLKKAGIKQEDVRLQHGNFYGPGYHWRGRDIIMCTNNNGLTGEYYIPGQRPAEYGYLSYVGIEGAPMRVKEVARAINELAYYIKDESPNDFI